MARKRSMEETAAAAAAAAIAATQDQILLEPGGEDDPQVIEDVLAGLRRLDQGEHKVVWYVYSQHAGKSGNSEGYIEKLRSDQLDEARFKGQYGPGEYRIVGRTRDGAYVKGSHAVVRISDIGSSGGNRNGSDPSDPVALLREMREQDEKRATQRAELLKSTATIVAAPMATILAALISRRPSLDMPALITALRPQQNTLTEMTTALANLKQLDGGGGSHLDMVLKVLERLQDLPTGGGSEGWLGVIRDVVKEAAPTLRDFVGHLQQPTPALPPAAAAGPAFGPGVAPALPTPQPSPIPSSDAAAAAGAQPEANDMWKLIEPWLKRKAEDLLEEASTNMPVDLAAEHLLTAVQKKFGHLASLEDLRTLLSRPDWWTFVAAFHPPLAPFQAWVDDVRREMLAMLEESLDQQKKPTTESEHGQRT